MTEQTSLEKPGNSYDFETMRFGFWVFLATECLLFSGIFFLYFNERFFYPQAFALGSQSLNLKLGTINTAVLITSSFTMASALHFLKQEKKLQTLVGLLSTIALGILFLVIKGIELQEDYHNALLPGFRFHLPLGAPVEQELFQGLFLFAITLHALHLLIGLCWASFLTARLALKKSLIASMVPAELLGLYWHFVDIVWIFIFPLFYLVRGPT